MSERENKLQEEKFGFGQFQTKILTIGVAKVFVAQAQVVQDLVSCARSNIIEDGSKAYRV